VAPQFDSNYVYTFRPMTGSNGLAMTVQYGNYSNGTPLIQWRFAGGNKFHISDSGAGNGSYRISSWESPTKCLDNPGGQTANGTHLQFWDCFSNDVWQQWMISVDASTGSAFLKNVGSGKCLDDSNWVAAGSVPVIYDCTGSVTQKWRMTVGYWNPGTGAPTLHDGDAYVLLAGNGEGNMALDSRGQYTNGAQPALNSGIDTNKDDKFMMAPGSSPGTWVIRSQWNRSLCLDNPGNQTADGTGIQLWSCNGASNQNWILSNRPNGGLEIKNQQSGKCLTNQGANGGGDGTPVVIASCNSYDYTQIWLLAAN
jgi:hypothetical protein